MHRATKQLTKNFSITIICVNAHALLICTEKTANVCSQRPSDFVKKTDSTKWSNVRNILQNENQRPASTAWSKKSSQTTSWRMRVYFFLARERVMQKNFRVQPKK